MIPTILAATTSSSGEEFGMPRLGPFAVGMSNFHSFALFAVMIFAIATGWGTDRQQEGD